MPAPKHRQGEALAAYTAAILAEPGITTVALAERFGVTRDSITLVLTKPLTSGELQRTRASMGCPVRWYPGGLKPSPDAEVRDRITAFLTACAGNGAALTEIAYAIGRRKTLTELRLGQMRRDGLVDSRRPAAFSYGNGTRPARWYLHQFVPAEELAVEAAPPKVEKSRALTLDPAAPPIVPPSVKVTRAPAPVERFAVSVPPGWVGQITRDWREARLGQQR